MAYNDPEREVAEPDAYTAISETASPSILSLPSPPRSPTPAELSSIPDSPSSLTSDFPISSMSSSLFLSGTSSPGPDPQPIPIHDEHSSRTLVIPSLTVPQYDPARGDAVGNVKLWIIGAGLHECQAAANTIIREAPLVSEVGEWIFGGDGIASLRASTLSGAHQTHPKSMHDTKWNVEAYVADVSPDSRTQLSSMIDSILAAIQAPFVSLDRLLNDSEPSTTSFLPLLTSSTTHVHTAVIYLRSSPSTRHDQTIINELSPYIPLITISPGSPYSTHTHPMTFHPSSSAAESAATSTFRPRSLRELRDNLFLNPSTLHHLRTEAAERFLRWRDLNAALRQPDSPTVHPLDMHNSRESPPGSMLRPQAGRGRANSTSSVRSSGIIFGSSQITPTRPSRQRAMSGGVRSALAGVEEEDHQPDWMWNWESRFSRDVREQQQQQRRQPPASTSASFTGPAPLNIPTRMPLASTTSSSTILELTGSPSPRLPLSVVRDRMRAIPSPPALRESSPPRAGNLSDASNAEDESDDPLHLRSVLRLAVSVVPALFRRYRLAGRASSSAVTRVSSRSRRRSHSTDSERSHGGKGRRKEPKMSWGMFGLGVSVGVVISICIVGLGVELSQRYALGAEIWPRWAKVGV